MTLLLGIALPFALPAGVLNSTWTVVVISWLLAALLMWIGAHLAGIGHVGLFRSLLATIAAFTVTWLAGELFAPVSTRGISVGMILGLILTWWVIKEIFSTSFGKAFLAWIFTVFAYSVTAMLGINSGRIRTALSHLMS